MIKVYLRWCIATIHSGCPFQYLVSENTTMGELCEMILKTNNEWWGKGWVGAPYSHVKICGENNTYLDNSQVIGHGHYQNELYLVFIAG